MLFKSVSVRTHASQSDLAPTTVGCLFLSLCHNFSDQVHRRVHMNGFARITERAVGG